MKLKFEDVAEPRILGKKVMFSQCHTKEEMSTYQGLEDKEVYTNPWTKDLENDSKSSTKKKNCVINKV